MTRVLVTGGTGVLGREVVTKLIKADYTVRVMSRKSKAASQWPQVEWAQADLTTGIGLSEAVAGVDTIIHAATDAGVTPENATVNSFFRKTILRHDGGVDVQGTKLLLEHARRAGVAHCIFISIAGIDYIPFAYYRHKLEAEALVRESGIPWSIVRATQFYQLVDVFVRTGAKWPVLALPTDLRGQPVDAGDVAAFLCACVAKGPAGRLPDFGGPEVFTLGEIARTWLDIRGLNKRIIRIPLPGKTAQAIREGRLTCPDEKQGTTTWKEWVRRTYPRSEKGNKVIAQV